MAAKVGLRASKKAATRVAISDIATRLFMERGFEAVTVDEIAVKANVSRLTVFNYFPRKEDLFFDRQGEGEAHIEAALAARSGSEALSTSLRRLFRRAIKEKQPFVQFTDGIGRFWRTVRQSPALRARANELRDEFATWLAAALAKAAGRSEPDPEARLAAQLLVAAWSAAHAEALRRHASGARRSEVEKVFVRLVERGLDGMSAALSKTPYA